MPELANWRHNIIRGLVSHSKGQDGGMSRPRGMGGYGASNGDLGMLFGRTAVGCPQKWLGPCGAQMCHDPHKGVLRAGCNMLGTNPSGQMPRGGLLGVPGGPCQGPQWPFVSRAPGVFGVIMSISTSPNSNTKVAH